MLPEIRKNYGAFYTPKTVAEFLTDWAIRDARDVVFDPSAGAGVFLFAARNRILQLGGNVGEQVRGVELSPATFDQTRTAFSSFTDAPDLIRGDFFAQSAASFGTVDAVIGNPPFIRYQRFTGEVRKRALRRAAEAGVTLSELCSSWAPFLVHATTFIAQGGRMAVVAPAELSYAVYAKPVVQFLSKSFANVKLLVFEQKLFPDLSEDTVLVLAEGRGETHESFTLHALNDATDLNGIDSTKIDEGEAPSAWTSGVARLVEYLIPSSTRDLYREIVSSKEVIRLGTIATAGIGYVTGNNDFFHLSAELAKEHGIPGRYLVPSIRNARDVKGLTFTRNDWSTLHEAGSANLLLSISPTTKALPRSLERYLSIGEKLGVPKAYKCRMRTPWYSVPHVYVGDAFLSYMNSGHPKLFLNTAKAVAPNTLHVVRVRRGAAVTPKSLAVAWWSSLTALSCEIEGHSMGGGMLKLEPRESARVALPILSIDQDCFAHLDTAARTIGPEAVRKEVDAMVSRTTGISTADLRRLKEAATILGERRTGR